MNRASALVSSNLANIIFGPRVAGIQFQACGRRISLGILPKNVSDFAKAAEAPHSVCRLARWSAVVVEAHRVPQLRATHQRDLEIGFLPAAWPLRTQASTADGLTFQGRPTDGWVPTRGSARAFAAPAAFWSAH